MKVTADHLNLIRDMGAAYLAPKGYTLDDVQLGSDAWNVLHYSGAYKALGAEHPSGYADYNDAHLKTALAAVMPNAVFKTKYLQPRHPNRHTHTKGQSNA